MISVVERVECVTTAEYRNLPWPSQSDLKRCWTEPELYYLESIAKTRNREPSAAMRFGTLLEYWLQYGDLHPDYVVPPDDVLSANGARSGGRYKAWRQAIPDHVIDISLGEYDATVRKLSVCAHSVARHGVAHSILNEADWHPRFTAIADGVRIKGELDLLWSAQNVIADVKAVKAVAAGAFANDVVRYGWDLQAYVYSQMAQEYNAGQAVEYVWIAIRNTPPHDVETYRATDEQFELGRRKFAKYLEWFRLCAATNCYRSRTHGQLVDLSPPRWAMHETESLSIEALLEGAI